MKYFVATLALLAMFLALPVQAQAAHAVGLSWGVPTSGGAPTGYNVYRTSTSGGCSTVTASGCSKIGTTAVPTTTFTDTTVAGGQTYFWVVTAFNATGESGPSNQVTASVPPDAPTAPGTLNVTSVH